MRSTAKLQMTVVDEPAWDSSVDSSEISGTSAGEGVMTLEGDVTRYGRKEAAENAAKPVAGVKAGVNDLDVHLVKWTRREDTTLAKAAVRALEWHSSVSKESVKVTVENGWITLEERSGGNNSGVPCTAVSAT